VWAPLGPQAPFPICVTANCRNYATYRFVAAGVGSRYCLDCKAKLEAQFAAIPQQLPTSPIVDHQGRVLKEMKLRDEYWLVGADGVIFGIKWAAVAWDHAYLALGSLFISREYAEAHAKRLRAEQRLRQIAAELNKDWRPDWAAKDNGKAIIYYDHAHKRWSIDVWVYPHCQYNSWPAFHTRYAAEEAIRLMGEKMGDLL